MGRQIQLHMLPDDCRQLLDYLRERDPVVVVDWNSDSPAIENVEKPCTDGGVFCLWNRSLLPVIQREYIHRGGHSPYYRIDSRGPVIELIHPNPNQELWNGRQVLTQGRAYSTFEYKGQDFKRWYDGLVYWIRKHFVRNPIPHLGGFVGPAAHDWYRRGGTLLPMLRPPVNQQWLSWLEAQDQHRRMFL